MRNLVALLIVACSFSCADKVEKEYEKSFFDIPAFVDSLLVTEGNKDEVLRKVVIDNENEEKVLTRVDMTEIFGYLKQFNINRPRWYDKYSVERTADIETYTSLDEDLEVKKLSIYRFENKIANIRVLYKSKTLISSSEKQVIWAPSNKLSIISKSKSLGSAEQNMEMTWSY